MFQDVSLGYSLTRSIVISNFVFSFLLPPQAAFNIHVCVTSFYLFCLFFFLKTGYFSLCIQVGLKHMILCLSLLSTSITAMHYLHLQTKAKPCPPEDWPPCRTFSLAYASSSAPAAPISGFVMWTC